ncbi:Myosin-2 heavy chain [Tetrabaena socialis]|uniref:Myosin-2 heavy chain n=1 Tax=Tetrabaena socialis TaxID=47790 RepID=A0A2J7ZYL0_9CHLO|nr:Myosin-2 heavy chain [Tetrabaena socialis]|eukprot:PNH05355.1 Myosin-2 heavy chain [Tetrabaena socialis]
MDQTSALATLSRGARVFYRKDANTWLSGQFLCLATEASVSVQPDTGSGVLSLPMDSVLPANPVLQDGIPDVVQLSYLNEPGILYNLEHRYQADGIYTWAGPVLIALNPCKTLPLYTPEVASEYKQAARESVTTLAPHIYLVAAAAFRQMLRNNSSQSLVVTGESGAGKTETTKKAMQYFATLAGGTGVEDQVLETNPILEAFGNAKTLRNHNSSRFGKLIQIHFNGSHHICGATIKTYLLEKSRVAYQLNGERSFHIFYQLVRGATVEERKTFILPPKVQDFRFLAQSGCFDIADVDDAAEFRAVRQALLDVGIASDTQATLFKLLSGLLWLGNIEFEESGTGDSTKVRQTPALEHAAVLLGVSPEALVTALTTRRIVAPGEVVIKLLKVGEALEARNSLAKAVYSSIFNWIVTRINARLGSGKATSGLYIAILDIYGFEQFDRNSFEQLCINYANERLQQQFTHHLFKLEQLEYESEGVDWTKVEFIDNQECVDVFEVMPPKGLGMLAVLDSQCKFPRATDATLHTQLLDALGSRGHFATNPRVPGSFIIRHYAGSVQYDTNGLLDKNKDTLGADLIKLIASSSKPLLADLGTAVQDEADRSIKKGQTVITRFGQQLRELVSELDSTGLHFVRCIKPNARLAPNCLEPAAVLHQLRCCGVLEVARVAAAGFPTRYQLGAFASRYSVLLSSEEQQALLQQQQGCADQRKVCLVLLERFGLRAGQYQLGHTKVFFRPGVLGMVEDRWAHMQAAVLSVQAGWRMYRCRLAYLQLRRAAMHMQLPVLCVALQALWRARAHRLAYHDLVAKNEAALVFQTAWRGHAARARFLLVRRAVVTIQTRGYRTWKFSRWLARAMQARNRAELNAEEVRVKSKLEADWFSALRAEYSISMEDVPTALAAWRDCCGAGATTIDLVKEALSVWQNPPMAVLSSPREALETTQALAMAVGATTGQLPASSLPAYPAPSAIQPVAEAALLASPVPMMPHAPPPRPPVMVMNSANVTPAVVNRFELAQELAIQVERLNLENVKLQKQLQLERSLTQRYQHKCEEQSVNWLDQVRLLQAYIQKCRAMFGDSQLPPLPKQVAAVTQPSEAARQGSNAGGQEEIPIASAAMGGAMSAARATLAQDAAAAPGTTASAGRASVDAQAITPGSVSAARASLEQDGSTAAQSLAAAHARSASSGPVQASSAAQPAATSTSSAAAAEPSPPPPSSILRDTQPDVTRNVSMASQTDPVPEPLPAPEPAPVALVEPPPPLATSCSATQTPASSQGHITAAVGTETGPEGAPQLPMSLGAAAARQGAAVGGPAEHGVATAAVLVASRAGEEPALTVPSPPASLRSGSVSSEPGPSSSVGGQQVSAATSISHSQQQQQAGPSSMPRSGGGAVLPPANASQRYVAKLGEELEKVMQVLPDDVAFIREVQEGQLVAPEMDPGVELFKLKKKFDVWKREFKEKLRTTEEVLRKIEHMESRPTPGHHGSDTLRPSQSLRVSGPASAAAPQGAGGRVAGGSAAPEAMQRPGQQDTNVSKRKTGSSSKLLNKLFSGGAR